MNEEHKRLSNPPPYRTVADIRGWFNSNLQHLVNTKCQALTLSELDTLIPGPVIGITIDGQPLDLPDGAMLMSIAFSKTESVDPGAKA